MILIAGFGISGSLPARAEACAICGKPLTDAVYSFNDAVTGQKKLVCSVCAKSPACYICGLPFGADGIELADGRHLCARDAKTVVLKADEAVRICDQVKEQLDRLFSRFLSFPTNVAVTVIDRIDVDALYHPPGNDFESPNLLGCIQAVTNRGEVRYQMNLMSGLPLAELKETCAHEYSHAWINEHVDRARRGLGRNAEEGFCELIGYLLMDAQGEAGEKNRVLKNRYTRGQIDLFVEAEQRYGFDQVLDWMQYGTAAQLEPGHVEELRNVVMPVVGLAPAPFGVATNLSSAVIRTNEIIATSGPSAPASPTIQLQGILWSSDPTAIINGRSFGVNAVDTVKCGDTLVTLRCLAIQPRSVFIRNVASGADQELYLSDH